MYVGIIYIFLLYPDDAPLWGISTTPDVTMKVCDMRYALIYIYIIYILYTFIVYLIP